MDEEWDSKDSVNFKDRWRTKRKLEIKSAEVYMMSTNEGWKIVGTNLKTKMYLADTDANMHMVENGSLLQNIKDSQQDVMVGGKRILQLKTKGDLAIKTKEGPYIGLLGCLQVPGFGKNIMSISSFVDRGARFENESNKAWLHLGRETVTMNRRGDGMFYLKGSPVGTKIDPTAEVHSITAGDMVHAMVVVLDSESVEEEKLKEQNLEVKEKEDSNIIKKLKQKPKQEANKGTKKSPREKEDKSKWKSIDYMEAHWKFNHQTGELLNKTLNYYKLRPTAKLVLCNGCAHRKARRKIINKADLAKAMRPRQ